MAAQQNHSKNSLKQMKCIKNYTLFPYNFMRNFRSIAVEFIYIQCNEMYGVEWMDDEKQSESLGVCVCVCMTCGCT